MVSPDIEGKHVLFNNTYLTGDETLKTAIYTINIIRGMERFRKWKENVCTPILECCWEY